MHKISAVKEHQYNVLMITNKIYPYLNANSEIVYRMAELLNKKFNVKISILGYFDPYIKENSGVYFAKTEHVNSVEKRIRIRERFLKKYPPFFPKKRKEKIKSVLLNPILLFDFLKYQFNRCLIKPIDYFKKIKRLLKKESYDCIIVFSHPFEPIIAVEQLSHKIQIPIIFYQLDAWATSFYHLGDEKVKSQELKIIKAVDSVIVTDLLYNEYKEELTGELFNKKIIPLEFPNIIKYGKNIISRCFDSDKINCVFAGTFYKEIRNPKYAVNLFMNLNKYKNIVFHFFGEHKGYMAPYNLTDNIVLHGSVDSATALSYMQQADILINIGNTVLNQIPSKILTYISLGKPILNIIKNTKCPTLKYVNKYPITLNILETEEVLQEDVDRVKNFIVENKGKEIPFDTIRELYYDCTPEYVGGKVYEIIEKVVNRK